MAARELDKFRTLTSRDGKGVGWADRRMNSLVRRERGNYETSNGMNE